MLSRTVFQRVKITFRSIVAYVLGIPTVLLGVVALFTSPLAGVLLVAGGLLALPVVRRKLDAIIGVEFSGGAATGIFLVCAVVGMGVLVLSVGGGGTGSVPGSDVSNVSVRASSSTPADANNQISIVWNSRAQSSVDPDSGDLSIYNAEDGEKFLVVRLRITNSGTQDIELTPRLLQFQSGGVIYDYQGLFGSGQGMSGVTLTPGAEYTGWTVYSIPSDITDGQLVVNQDVYYDSSVAVAFEHDPEMAINVSD